MLIELFGPPTAGKSTLERALVDAGVAVGTGEVRVNGIPSAWLAFHSRLAEIYERSDAPNREKLRRKALAELARSFAADADDAVHVVDEGVAQCGLSLACRHPELAPWYFETMPVPRRLVALNAPASVLVERNLARGERCRVSKTERAAEAFEPAIATLAARGCRMLRFDTSTTRVEEIVEEIRAWIP